MCHIVAWHDEQHVQAVSLSYPTVMQGRCMALCTQKPRKLSKRAAAGSLFPVLCASGNCRVLLSKDRALAVGAALLHQLLRFASW